MTRGDVFVSIRRKSKVVQLDSRYLPPSVAQNPQIVKKKILAWFMLIVKKKNRLESALDLNTAQLSFGTPCTQVRNTEKQGE